MPRTATFPVVILSRPIDDAFRTNPKENAIEVLAAPITASAAKRELSRLRRKYPRAAMVGVDEFSAECYREIRDLQSGVDRKVIKERAKLTTAIQRAYKKATKGAG